MFYYYSQAQDVLNWPHLNSTSNTVMTANICTKLTKDIPSMIVLPNYIYYLLGKENYSVG